MPVKYPVEYPGKKCVNFKMLLRGINACEIPCGIPCEKMFELQMLFWA